MAENEGATAGLYMLMTLLIVLVVVGLLYFGGFFASKKSIDININTPGNKPGIVMPLIR